MFNVPCGCGWQLALLLSDTRVAVYVGSQWRTAADMKRHYASYGATQLVPRQYMSNQLGTINTLQHVVHMNMNMCSITMAKFDTCRDADLITLLQGLQCCKVCLSCNVPHSLV